MLFDHYLAVQSWTPEFVSLEAKINSTMVWVRFLGLSMVYYNKSVLLTLAEAIGFPIRVAMNTLNCSRGKFARVFVEIDLSQSMIGKVLVGYWYKV